MGILCIDSVNFTHLVFQNKFSFDVLVVLFELFCPLLCLVNSTLWFPQLSKLISFQVHQLFGPPQLALVPRTCAPCAETLRTGVKKSIDTKPSLRSISLHVCHDISPNLMFKALELWCLNSSWTQTQVSSWSNKKWRLFPAFPLSFCQIDFHN